MSYSGAGWGIHGKDESLLPQPEVLVNRLVSSAFPGTHIGVKSHVAVISQFG